MGGYFQKDNFNGKSLECWEINGILLMEIQYNGIKGDLHIHCFIRHCGFGDNRIWNSGSQ